jgi:hypothetical protein
MRQTGDSVMSKYLLGAATVALMMGSTGAFALEDCQGAKTGWTQSFVGDTGGETCYHGGSGNEVECSAPGNHVVVTDGATGYFMLTQPGNSPDPQQCKVPGSDVTGECIISRSNGHGSTDFGYCD